MRLIALAALAALAALVLLGGCAGVAGKGRWGEATGWPRGTDLKSAAIDAARDPTVWLPMAGAAVLAIGDLDEELSDWASDETPLFGNDASDISDGLRDFTAAAYLASALVAPSGTAGNKARGLLSGAGTVLLASGVTEGLKNVTNRDRPNGGRNNSFPSGHATQAASLGAMAITNLEYIDMPEWARITSKVALHGAAIGTAWARVEAEKHYAADVLVGYAIGRFFASFMNAAFFDVDGAPSTRLSFAPLPGGGALTIRRAVSTAESSGR